MTSEELQARLNTLSSPEDAYALACEQGFTGGMEDFEALCRKAAEAASGEEMDLDAMDQVSGGTGYDLEPAGDWYASNKEFLTQVGSSLVMPAAVAVDAPIDACGRALNRRLRASMPTITKLIPDSSEGNGPATSLSDV